MGALSHPFSFCYKMTSEFVRTFQVLDYNSIYQQINLLPLIFQFKENLRKPCLPDLVSIMIVAFSYPDISQTHLTHLSRHSLATTSPNFLYNPFLTIFIGHQATRLFINYY